MLVSVPSKGRAGSVTTESVLEGVPCTLFVPAVEASAYRKHHERVIEIPDAVKGITSTRNWILEYAKSKNERAIIQCDDDGQRFVKFEDGKPGQGVPMEHTPLMDLFSNMFDMIADLKTNLFGFQLANDGRFYREYSPFSFLSTIVGNFMGILDDGQRFDERLRVKEDYDFSLQSLRSHRRVLRHNKYAFMVSHLFDAGGCASYRTHRTELEAIRTLRKKWGSKIIQPNPKKHWEIIVRAPLKGI